MGRHHRSSTRGAGPRPTHAPLACLAAALTLIPLGAGAQIDEPESYDGPSPKWGSVELGAGTYLPNIDSEFSNGSTPYQTTFGSKRRWTFRLAGSYALLSGRWGRLDVGLRTGYFRASGKGLLEDGTASADSTTLTIVPTSPIVTYHFDTLGELVPWMPLSPYVRLGLERYNWWVTNGGGSTTKRGATNGWSVTAGLALSLGSIDPVSVREMDRDSGINNVYLFFDATRTQVDDFGSKKSWNLSDKHLSLAGGLLVVF